MVRHSPPQATSPRKLPTDLYQCTEGGGRPRAEQRRVTVAPSLAATCTNTPGHWTSHFISILCIIRNTYYSSRYG